MRILFKNLHGFIEPQDGLVFFGINTELLTDDSTDLFGAFEKVLAGKGVELKLIQEEIFWQLFQKGVGKIKAWLAFLEFLEKEMF